MSLIRSVVTSKSTVLPHPQLPLDIHLSAYATFVNFVPGNNALLLELLQQSATQQGELQLYFWGAAASGKTHLLQACCRLAAENGYSACYLPLQTLQTESPQILENLEQVHLLCLDQLDTLAAQTEWEEALFHLINKIRQQQHRVIFAATANITALPWRLPDLASRLAWGPVFQLQDLADGDKQHLLQQRAQQQGLELSAAVSDYLLQHYPRDLHWLMQALEKLDQASLAAQRRLTIPFVKQVLADV